MRPVEGAIVIGVHFLWGFFTVPYYKALKERGDTDVFFCLMGIYLCERLWTYFVDKVNSRDDEILLISLQCASMVAFSTVAFNASEFDFNVNFIILDVGMMFLRLVFFIFE
jgi:hypothetical protein